MTAVTEQVVDRAIEASRAGELPPHFYVGRPLADNYRRAADQRGAESNAPCQRSGCGQPAGAPIHLRPGQ